MAQVSVGSDKGAWEGQGNEATRDTYAHLESYVCRTYQLCCEPSDLLDLRVANGGTRQCKSQHEGLKENAAFILSDPSHPQFCPLISGVHDQLSASPGVCSLLEEASVDGFSLDQCRADYCNKGLEGYEEFISYSVQTFQYHSRTIGLAALFLLVLLLVQLANIRRIMKHYKDE